MKQSHPGFARVASSIQHSAYGRKHHLTMERAEAILAASSRRASPAAKKRNPRLKRV